MQIDVFINRTRKRIFRMYECPMLRTSNIFWRIMHILHIFAYTFPINAKIFGIKYMNLLTYI